MQYSDDWVMTFMRTLVLLLSVLTALGPLSIDTYLPGLPTLADSFGVPVTRMQLTVSAYFAGLAIGQLIYGPASDAFGRKVPLYVGLTLYTLASIGCTLAPSVDAMIGLRFVQALGGSVGVIIARAVVRDLVQGQEAAHMFSILLLVVGAAPILAPLAGSYILKVSSWRVIFLLMAAFGVTALVVAFARLPETLPPDRRTRGGLANVALNYRHLLCERRFMSYTMGCTFALGNLSTYITVSAHLFMDMFKLTPTHYAWLFGANAAGLIGASQLNRLVLLPRWSFYRIFSVTLVLHLAAGTMLFAAAIFNAGFWPVWVSLSLVLLTVGLLSPNGLAVALSGEARLAGSAAALTSMGPYMIGALTGGMLGFLPDHPSSIGAVIAANGFVALLSYRILRIPAAERA